VRRLLNAFADRELGWLAAWRVRQHLSGCADCAAELAAFQRLGERTRAWRNRAPRVTLPPRIATALSAARSPAPVPAFPARAGARSAWKFWEMRIMRRGLASAVIVATVATVALVVRRRADPAYAALLRVASAYRQIDSVHSVWWHLDPEGDRVKSESWYARPYRAWSRRDGRLEICDGSVEWQYVPGARTAVRRPFPKLAPEAWQRLFDIEKHLERARRGFRIEDLGMETVDGRSLRKLRLAGDGHSERETWWLDPQTSLVLRTIGEQSDDAEPPNWKVVSGSIRIEYNRAPPPGIFTFVPPPGVQVIDAAEGSYGQFVDYMRPLRTVATRQAVVTDWGSETAIELLAFRRSVKGNLYAVMRDGQGYGFPLRLTDADGGRYVSRGLPGGAPQNKTYAVVFFPEKPKPARRGLTFQLRVCRVGFAKDPPLPGDLAREVARFDNLKPEAAPDSFEPIVREFAEHEMHVSFDFLRASGLGLTAFREGRTSEALAHLEDAAKLATNLNREDTQEVYLTLAELYCKAGRRDEGKAMAHRAFQAATGDSRQALPALRAAEAIERLGDSDTAARWLRQILFSKELDPRPVKRAVKVARDYERLSGDHDGANRALEQILTRWLRQDRQVGFGDGWDMGQAFEAMDRPELALEAYTKGLETSGLLASYRKPKPHPSNRVDAERMIAAIRRLGGEAAVQRLTPRSADDR
jgi:tetratricopeptide (TPR) repeat protein